MSATEMPFPSAAGVLTTADASGKSAGKAATKPAGNTVPIWIARDTGWLKEAQLTDAQRAWVQATGFKGTGNRHLLIPGSDGTVAGVAFGIGDARDPMARPEILLGLLAGALPPGHYRVASALDDAELAGVAWGLGAYRFRRYKTGGAETGAVARLELPSGADLDRVLAVVDGIWLGRDLVNTPAGDLGPEELEAAARRLAKQHGASISSIVGDDLLAKNFPMIHAVGRASNRPPRLIDLRWGRAGAPTVTLVGKGICFDTGGLDIKPPSGMLLMKKDMGGAAAALALAHAVMATGLDVRLRVLIPTAENSIAGNAFRPGDVLTSRAGKTVEIGNTDAEGRLVLADALALADEESPDTLVSFATLTGAARVALGPELPPLFTDDDAFADALTAAGLRIGDPVWRMPLWSAYESTLDSAIADMNNVSDGPFAGSVTAALFLRRFVRQARRFAHLDIYGWRPAPKPLGPKGGEVQAARAVLEVLRTEQPSSKP